LLEVLVVLEEKQLLEVPEVLVVLVAEERVAVG
jgi:hypothetical protein